MTIRCSAVRAISFIRCEETNTVLPSAARSRSSARIQRMPSVSRPLTGSSRITVWGSPSSAAAMPSRWPMPREKPPARRRATSRRPTASITSSTRERPMPQVWAIASRWWWALRPGWTERASSSAPTSRSGAGCWRYGLPLTVTDPPVGASSPRIIRMVVDLPAPFGPRKPVTTPGRTVKLRSSTASLAPYRLVNPRASIISSLLCDGCAEPRGNAMTPGIVPGRGRAVVGAGGLRGVGFSAVEPRGGRMDGGSGAG